MASVFRSSELRIPKGWPLYFPGEPPPQDVNEARLLIIHQLAAFFQGPGHPFLTKIDYTKKLRALFEFSDLRGKLPVEGFERGLHDTPVITLACLGCALYEALFTGSTPLNPNEEIVPPPSHKISVRVANYEPVMPMRYLKSNCLGKFVAVRGTVIRTSTVRPFLSQMNFHCVKCGHFRTHFFADGKYEVPVSCPTPGCKNKNLQPERGTAVTYDWQKIRLQEIVGDEEREEGRMPRTIECELTDDLVDSCIPGDEVTVTGIVKVMNTESEYGPRVKNRCLFLLYIEANAVHKKTDMSSKDADAVQFTARELSLIRDIALDADCFRMLTNSVCPAIFGHEKVKLALLLALFGGTVREVEKNALPIRSDIHILVVGDPGLGKSQMLQAASSISPRGVYVCGNTTSSAGLTVTVVKDGISGDFALEAGALVLGDQGICCVDEFDKMGYEQQALLEAMEQQSISIAKAGIVCSLSARTSVLAAANPVSGHYKLSPEAQTVIQEFYLTLRKNHQSFDSTPITTRQLESLIRLSEARAKMELRMVVTEDDANDVVELMKGSLFDIFADDAGVIDFGRSSGSSKASESKRFMQEVHRVSERECNSLYTTQDLYCIAQRVGLRVDNFDEFVEGLNNQGFLLKKGVRQWQVASTSFSQTQAQRNRTSTWRQ